MDVESDRNENQNQHSIKNNQLSIVNPEFQQSRAVFFPIFVYIILF